MSTVLESSRPTSSAAEISPSLDSNASLNPNLPEKAPAPALRPALGRRPKAHLSVPRDVPTRPLFLKELEIRGVGLHTGRAAAMFIRPATLASRSLTGEAAQASVNFRTQFKGFECQAPALWTRLSGTARSTALILRGPNRRKVELRTIEHFMAAALMSGLAHIDVEIVPLDGESEICELPVLDGSAAEWTRILTALASRNDLRRCKDLRRVWKIARPFELSDGDRHVRLLPSESHVSPSVARYHSSVDFGPAWKQNCRFEIDWAAPWAGRAAFLKEVAPARTFGFEHELEQLRTRGLALGAGFGNALLLNDTSLVNPGGFRVENELAAHKLIDAIGDLALLGAPLVGQIEVHKAGHSMHTQAVKDALEAGAVVEGWLTTSGEFQSA